MAREKSERILNLMLYLLSARRFLGREQIRTAVEGYADLSDEAFERAFERDKEDLRTLGVPIRTGSNSAIFEDDVGYRIPRGDFELPAVEFTADETRVIGVAAHVWQQAAMADSTIAAMGKLRAAGVDVDSARLVALAPTMTAEEPAFLTLWQANAARRRVRFDYREPGRVRTVEPWRVLCRNGAWYVVGRDVDKDEPRMFKLSRIVSDVTETGDAFVVRDDVDLDALTQRFAPREAQSWAVLAIRPGRAPGLRRVGVAVPDVSAPAGYEACRVAFTGIEQFAGIVRSAGADVLVLEPPELRAEVLRGLRRVEAS